jgi:isopropylmalate/homocitrate/citramalate synthase
VKPPSSADLPALAFDWNGERERRGPGPQLNDETLRDGLQSPSVREPPDDLRCLLMHLMADLGIEAATIGFPAAGERMAAQCRRLSRAVTAARLPLSLTCIARAREDDVAPIADLAQAGGRSLEAAVFIGASDIRRTIAGWSLDAMLRMVERSVRFGERAGLSVMFVAEDATRARPEVLVTLCRAAIRAGARRLCLADTTGCATPAGAARLVSLVRDEVIGSDGSNVQLDWHGHRDRGLAVANALAAAAAGADRVHGTALGVGERAGNAEMELLLVNLCLQGSERSLDSLQEYCRTAAEALGVAIPAWQPVAGGDARRTGTGLHADAVLKALGGGLPHLADVLYSGLPAGVGGTTQIAVSPVSGKGNVRHWLMRHGYDPHDSLLVDALLATAKGSRRALTDRECEDAVQHALAPAAGQQ